MLPTDLFNEKVRMSQYFENHCSAEDRGEKGGEIAGDDEMEN